MENPRTQSARDHDDHKLIDEAVSEGPTPRFEGKSGGSLQEDIATEAELERVRDPEAHEGVDKKDDIHHGQATPSRQPADKTP